MKVKKAFSLIEVIIASMIISLTVFGVYKLIGENSKLISNRDTYMQKTILLADIKECIENIGIALFTGSTQTQYSFNFGPTKDDCIPDLYSADYGFTSVNIGGKDYYLFGTITNSGATFIDWELGVFEETTGKITKSFTQKNN